VLESSAKRILERLGPDDLLLDVGAWIKPFNRADHVIDLMPYETRGEAGSVGDMPERFSADTWVRRDICDHEPWPFADGQFDFAICSHTLEDIRDPVWVCAELTRVARAGYIEVPSRLEEQTYGIQGPWVGWGHHHWLIDVDGSSIDFVFKHHVMHGRESDHFPSGFTEHLTEEQLVQSLWWEGSFEFRERYVWTEEGLDPYLAGFVSRNRHLAPAAPEPSLPSRAARRVRGRLTGA
jgi:Methyltransferase domain